ncbi:MAG: 50S ribosomal protein L25 [Patescibacteria group bacterium]|jgi:large subunit ribosomal protein L25
MTIKLEAKSRELLGKKVFKLRENGEIPGVVFGHGDKNSNIQLDYVPFEKIYQEAGESTIIDLVIDGGKVVKTIISDVQHDPVKGRLSHVDFRIVKMDEKITAGIPLEFFGESKVVKEDGGSIVHNISEVEIECLPGDLIHEIKVDLSVLKTFDDVIMIKDLALPKNVEILGHESDDVVALAVAVQEEKEEAPVVVATEGAVEGVAPAEGAEIKPEEKKTEKK